MGKLKLTYVIELAHHHKMSKHQSCLCSHSYTWVQTPSFFQETKKVKANNKEIRCYIPKEWSRWISGEPIYKMSPCALPINLPFPPLLTFPATKVSGQDYNVKRQFLHDPSPSFLDPFPTQQWLHVFFVFMFPWPIQLPASALIFFIHVTIETTYTKKTNLKDIHFMIMRFKLLKLISTFFRNQSTDRGDL